MQEKDIFLKDVNEMGSCSICPAFLEEICCGGWKASHTGEPIEPPCCGWDDDTNITDWVSDQLRYMY